MYNKIREERESKINNNFMFVLAMFFALFPHQAFAQATGGDAVVTPLLLNLFVILAR